MSEVELLGHMKNVNDLGAHFWDLQKNFPWCFKHILFPPSEYIQQAQN